VAIGRGGDEEVDDNLGGILEVQCAFLFPLSSFLPLGFEMVFCFNWAGLLFLESGSNLLSTCVGIYGTSTVGYG